MSPTLEAFFRSWPLNPGLLAACGLAAGIYLRGWLALRQRNPQRWHAGRLNAFWGGLAAIYLALASPIEPFAALLLQVHMLQHLLLMMAAPPLLWLGSPLLPLLWGLPRPVRTYWVAPWLRSPALRALFARLTRPAVALPLFVAATWLWHAPAAYELALRSSGWHYLQHASFLATGLLFWYPVVRPHPSHPRWSRWLLLPYLILADVQNTVLSALLTFADHVLYPYYLQVPRLGGLSALEDQAGAGVLMWVPGSLAFLLPLFVIGFRLLYGQEQDVTQERAGGGAGSVGKSWGSGGTSGSTAGRIAQPLLTAAQMGLPRVAFRSAKDASFAERKATFPAQRSIVHSSPTHDCRSRIRGFDLLRVPLLGRFLQWRHARLAMQLPLAALAGVLILDGLRGPQVGPMNLAGVLPWIHWRGLLILGLLAAGNVFCMACPFLVPRTLARRWLPRGRSWPRWLRNKWLAVVLLVVFLWAYEAFSLWDSPWWTAWLAIGYFVLAFVIDGFFRGAAFCKYVCPIGQFNFVQSLVSPLEVQVRDAGICATCRTKDCIRGRDGIPGCELRLFQPRKAGNMDCTFCLDCVHACPHENIGILARPPGSDLWHDAPRSGVGLLSKRPDLAVLVIVLVFGAFTNAAGMVGPILEWRDRLGSLLGQESPLLVTSLFYFLSLLVLPLLAVGSAAVLSRRWGRLTASWFEVATRYSYALVPLGFSMWLAHYSFHFLTSYDTVIPTTQRFALDLGWRALGQPHWVHGCCRPVADWLPRLEVVILESGLLLSLYTGYRIALAKSPRVSQAVRALAPWAVLMTLLCAAGIWLVFQPMQMRGTLQG
jgi:cytochrome c oxidase assembly factor CtaG